MNARIERLGAPRKPWLVLSAVACTWALWLSTAAADLSRPETLDVTLLRADAILVATIREIQPTHGERYRVSLTDQVVVHSRWSEAPSRFELRAEALLPTERVARGAETPGIEAIRALPYRIDLRRGHRYLFLLAGGRHPSAPSDAATPFYELDDEGHVRCGSGFVYGLGSMGLICARPGDVAGEPPLESELRERLAAGIARARDRRPELAAERDADVQALEAPASEAP